MVRMAALLAVAGFIFQANLAAADSLDDIVARGEIAIGSKADYWPYGFRDGEGRIVGMEPELAADIAQRLGVKLRIEPASSANRVELLQKGKVDAIIATMAVTGERSKLVSFVRPFYYASGIAGLVPPRAGVRDEDGLKGKPVCAVKGNYANAELQSTYVQRELVVADSIPDAAEALFRGRCALFVYDDAALRALKRREPDKWKDYELIEFPLIDPQPWAIALRLEERPGALAKFMSKTILDWHKSGFLAQLEKKWLERNTAWVEAMQGKYRR
jgi:polar amino acid transport system substrate-binding protein